MDLEGHDGGGSISTSDDLRHKGTACKYFLPLQPQRDIYRGDYNCNLSIQPLAVPTVPYRAVHAVLSSMPPQRGKLEVAGGTSPGWPFMEGGRTAEGWVGSRMNW